MFFFFSHPALFWLPVIVFKVGIYKLVFSMNVFIQNFYVCSVDIFVLVNQYESLFLHSNPHKLNHSSDHIVTNNLQNF